MLVARRSLERSPAGGVPHFDPEAPAGVGGLHRERLHRLVTAPVGHCIRHQLVGSQSNSVCDGRQARQNHQLVKLAPASRDRCQFRWIHRHDLEGTPPIRDRHAFYGVIGMRANEVVNRHVKDFVRSLRSGFGGLHVYQLPFLGPDKGRIRSLSVHEGVSRPAPDELVRRRKARRDSLGRFSTEQGGRGAPAARPCRMGSSPAAFGRYVLAGPSVMARASGTGSGSPGVSGCGGRPGRADRRGSRRSWCGRGASGCCRSGSPGRRRE